MSIYILKSILAICLLLAGGVAMFSMLTLMGRAEKKADPARLRRTHRRAGYVFAVFLLFLSFLGIRIVVSAGDALSTRAVLHQFLGYFLLSLFFLKVMLARFYKPFLRIVPGLGFAVGILVLVVFSVTAGYYLLRAAFIDRPAGAEVESTSILLSGDVKKGEEIFSFRCASCHFPDREESKLGPGLKDLFRKDRLPHSGKPATEENVRRQLAEPVQSMPSFSFLVEQEMEDLMAYLKSL